MVEFPGGKVEAGETHEAALVRELREEINVEVVEADLAPCTFVTHHYPDFHLLLRLYICQHWQGPPEAREGQTLLWASQDELDSLPWCPANPPLLPHLRRMLSAADPT